MASVPATVDHVVSHVSGNNSEVGCLLIGSLTDSVCWASESSAYGAWVQTSGPNSRMAALRNDTLIASAAGGLGAVVTATGGFTAELDVINSIAHDVAFDVNIGTDANAASTAILTADHSNYATGSQLAGSTGTLTFPPPGSGTNQTAAPVFANAAAGDVHELAGSPTIDAGAGADSFTYTATSSHGTAASATVSLTVAVEPVPFLMHANQSHKTWLERAQRTRRHHKPPPPVGTTFTFSLNEPASITLTFTHQVTGRKVHGKCVAQTRQNPHAHACKRTVTAGLMIVAGHFTSGGLRFTIAG